MQQKGVKRLYNNLSQQQPYYQYGGYNGVQYPSRPMQMEPQGIQPPAAYITPNTNYLKGRPVVSLEEARASQIDLDGSLHIFTDIGNKKIYTKQINLDGTATLNTYVLAEEVAAAAPEYVTRAEFNEVLSQIQTALLNKAEEKVVEEKGKASSNIVF